MHRARWIVSFVLVACGSASALAMQSSSQAANESGSASAPDLSVQRALIDQSNTARKSGDYAVARAKVVEAVASLLARPPVERDAAWLALLDSAGSAALDAQDARTANEAWKCVFDERSKVLADDHADLQHARLNLALTLSQLGDLEGARALQEKVLEVDARTLPDDHPDLQIPRQHLAVTLKMLGDLAGARALEEKVLAVYQVALPDDHPRLQDARGNLGATLYGLGDLAGARVLFEKVLEVRSRTLPDDHPQLQSARANVALAKRALGDLAGARSLQQKVVEVDTRTLPDDHPNLQNARQNLAITMHELGDITGAKALEEKVLEVRSRTLPDDHLDLQSARINLAAMLQLEGDLAGARALNEKVLEIATRSYPDDHPDLQLARQNLAVTLDKLGDRAGARTLFEQVLEVDSRALPDDHPALQNARLNLAVALKGEGDLAGARTLEEKVLEVDSTALPDDDPNVQSARSNLGETLRRLGDLDAAKALFERVLEIRTRTLRDDHPDLQAARRNLAVTLAVLGELAGARALFEKVLDVSSRTLPEDHPDLQGARANLAAAIASEHAREIRGSGGTRARPISNGAGAGRSERDEASQRCAVLIADVCRADVRAAHAAILESPAREAEERCAFLSGELGTALSFSRGAGVWRPLVELEAPTFVLAETTRGAALASAELARRAAHSTKYAALRDAVRKASDELAVLAQNGTTSEDFDSARVKRESAERELVALAREVSGGDASGLDFDVDRLAARLAEHEAAVGFRRYANAGFEVVVDELDSTGRPRVRETAVESLCAYVVRSRDTGEKRNRSSDDNGSAHGPVLTFVDFGPIAPIEDAVRAWRAALGVARDTRGVAAGASEESESSERERGARLRELAFDPLLQALAGAERIVVALDDVLNLVPLDALPLDDGRLLGDRWPIETRTTLTELMLSCEPPPDTGELVLFGDVDYGRANAPIELASADVERGAGILRGGNWAQGFAALPSTGVEVRGIARCFADPFGSDAPIELCEQASATRERFLVLARKARFLHVATHGWFAPESVKSWSDPEPLDKRTGLGMRTTGAEQVKRMSPMLLCGLALAGANSPENAIGRAPGLVTADELSTLDLSNCELAVLSACDTNVGERRAGQGVASLQKALQMAGARSVITSLWKVPDEATKELMLDFYRRLWVEKKPKHQALWEAKTKLREAKDERGVPKYATRDWAAWVLTGEPD